MDALLAAIESAEAPGADAPVLKRRRMTKKEASAETQALIDRLTAKGGLTVEGAHKLRTDDVRCRPPAYASFDAKLPQFRLRSVEDAARAEDIVILYAHVHGEPLHRNRFRFNVDSYLNDAELRASLNALTSLKDLETFCKTRFGTVRRYRRMLAEIDRETINKEERLPRAPARQPKVLDGVIRPTYDMVCRRIDLEPGLPEPLASIATLGDTILTVGQIVDLLKGAASGHLPVSTTPMQTPPVGAMFIFASDFTRYKLDGYEWGTGIQNYRYTSDRVTRINAIYAKSTTSNVQRRCYVHDAGYVLVHYVTNNGKRRSVVTAMPPVPTPVAAPLGRAPPRPLYLPPGPASVAAASYAFQKSIAAMVYTKAIFQAPGTQIGTAIMRLAATTTDVSTVRSVCAVAVYLSGTKATRDEKLFHFGEIKALVMADRWIDALEYTRTVSLTL